jgi:hypothetical protein
MRRLHRCSRAGPPHNCPIREPTRRQVTLRHERASQITFLIKIDREETELIREIATDPEDFGKQDGIERAIRDLAGVGLLHRHHGPFILPSRAALCAYELWGS